MRNLLLAALLLTTTATCLADGFTVHRKGGAEPGRTLLVVGGIQGDEPGGFMAASLLVTHYTISKGALWVAPNLNFRSIIARHRGLHGDMNRKFADLPRDDPEFGTITAIKALITDPQVDGILNLHDGSGFYRERYVDARHNPNRWGQSIIVDQPTLDTVPFGALAAIAERVKSHVNNHLIEPAHRFGVKDTRTRWGDEEMAKTLTFFAIEQGKPAFGLEASKDFGTTYRAYYHLLALEGYMNAFGIEYQRAFPLTPAGVEHALQSHPRIALFGSKVILDVANAREHIGYVPLKRGSQVEFMASSPLVALVEREGGFQVSYGNRRMTHLHPQYFDYDDSLDVVTVTVDGREVTAPFGSIIPVKGHFEVKPLDGYRVNLIGFPRPPLEDEAGITVARDDFMERFSVDRAGQVFRIEVYRDDQFSGMVLVDFSNRPAAHDPQWCYTGRSIALGEVIPAETRDDLGR